MLLPTQDSPMTISSVLYHLKSHRDWQGDSVGKLLTVQAWGVEVRSLTQTQKPDGAACESEILSPPGTGGRDREMPGNPG